MKNISFVILILSILTTMSCCESYADKREYIKNKLEKTNKHVEEGAWYATKHGELVIPDILKNKEEVLESIEE